MPISTIDFRMGYSSEIDLKLMFYWQLQIRRKVTLTDV